MVKKKGGDLNASKKESSQETCKKGSQEARQEDRKKRQEISFLSSISEVRD